MTHEHAIESLAAERYLLDEMSEQERDSFEEHFFSCDECASDMRLGAQLKLDAPAVFTAAPVARPLTAPITMTPRRRWIPSPSVALPWAAAAVLALALVAQVRPGQPVGVTDEATAVAAVALRPASRGAVPEVPLPGAGRPLALALDVNVGSPGDPLTYALIREDGAAVTRGQAPAPAAGVPLVVVVPAAQLDANASYLLTLTTGGGAPPAEYRFNTAAR